MPSEDSKPVKKEDAGHDEADNKCLSSIIKKKSANNAAPSIGKSRPKQPLKIKKEEPQSDDYFNKPIKPVSSSSRSKERSVVDEDDVKPITKRNSDKKELKKKKGEEKKAAVSKAEQNGNKKERKVYDLPGQKRDPPEERDPLRIFYETLYQQVPHSEMAQFWMMESGLLALEEARNVFEKKKHKSQQQKFSSPVKASSVTRVTKSVTVKKKVTSCVVSSNKKQTTESTSKQSKKRKLGDGSSEEDSDDDFIVSRTAKKQKAK